MECLHDNIGNSETPPSPQDQLLMDEFSETSSRTKAVLSDLSARGTGGIIPDWNTIQRLIKIGMDETSPRKRILDRDFDLIAKSFRDAYSGRRLFRTKDNYFGIAAQSLQEDDAVWVLAGAAVPMVLRRLPSGNWRLVGEAYVHGIMNGEAVKGGGVRLERIHLE